MNQNVPFEALAASARHDLHAKEDHGTSDVARPDGQQGERDEEQHHLHAARRPAPPCRRCAR
eukprot:2327193-Alexandrium_andersonii.AAC.1